MNDNIRAIWNRAASSHHQAETSRETQENFLNRFAELIVRECVKVCADRGTHHDGLYSAWAVDCSKRIEKHFGVE